MITTVFALTMICWKLYVQYRDELGVLIIRDKSKLHAIEDPRFSPSKNSSKEHAWRIWVPDGVSYELHIATGWQDRGALPNKSPKGPIILGPGEHSARATMMTGPQSNHWHLQLATPDDKRAIPARWLRWKNTRSAYRGVTNRTVASDTNYPLLLWSVQTENSDNQLRDGMIVWLQPVTE